MSTYRLVVVGGSPALRSPVRAGRPAETWCVTRSSDNRSERARYHRALAAAGPFGSPPPSRQLRRDLYVFVVLDGPASGRERKPTEQVQRRITEQRGWRPRDLCHRFVIHCQVVLSLSSVAIMRWQYPPSRPFNRPVPTLAATLRLTSPLGERATRPCQGHRPRPGAPSVCPDEVATHARLKSGCVGNGVVVPFFDVMVRAVGIARSAFCSVGGVVDGTSAPAAASSRASGWSRLGDLP